MQGVVSVEWCQVLERSISPFNNSKEMFTERTISSKPWAGTAYIALICAKTNIIYFLLVAMFRISLNKVSYLWNIRYRLIDNIISGETITIFLSRSSTMILGRFQKYGGIFNWYFLNPLEYNTFISTYHSYLLGRDFVRLW